MSLLELPRELISYLLAYLEYRDLLAVDLTCRTLHTLIAEEPLLQYKLSLLFSGTTNNVTAQRVVSERLQYLDRWNRAWKSMSVKRITSVPVDFEPSGLYDLTGGYYFLGETYDSRGNHARETVALRYVRLPSTQFGSDEEVKPKWEKVEVGESIVDFGVCAEEYDLVALVTVGGLVLDSSTTPNGRPEEEQPQQFSRTLNVHFRQISTGQPHPDAQIPAIPILKEIFYSRKFAIMLEIVGDLMALLVTFPMTHTEMPEIFYLINWKLGKKLSHFVAPWRSYSSFVFLAPDVLMFPNARAASLDIYRIPALEPGPASQVVPTIDHIEDGLEDLPKFECTQRLLLPTVRQSARLIRTSCRAEPNPMGPNSKGHYSNSSPTSTRPFSEDAEEAIITINFICFVQNANMGHEFPSFTCIVHRKSLLELLPLDKSSESINRDQPVFTELGSIENDIGWFTSSPGSDDSMLDLEYVSDSDESTSEGKMFDGVPWDQWHGEKVTRWFNHPDTAVRWITTTCGTRAVELESRLSLQPNLRRCKHMRVLDFNRLRVARAEHATLSLPILFGDSPNHEDILGEAILEDATVIAQLLNPHMALSGHEIALNRWDLDVEAGDVPTGYVNQSNPKVIRPGNARLVSGPSEITTTVFENKLVSSLPYVECVSADQVSFNYALMDEERVIGLNLDEQESRVTSIDVVQMGLP